MKPVATRVAIVGVALASVCAAQITTSQYDNARSGATLNEKILTLQNVNSHHFGKLGAFQVDGPVYAQPLFVPNVEIPGKGTHDVLYVATEHDSVFAFDANRPGGPPLWKVNFLDQAHGVIPLSEDMVQCPFIRPEVGITSTPVIDIKTGTLYVLARTAIRRSVADNEYFQHLHALAITTGVEKFGGPKLITASVPGRGSGRSGRQVDFDPLHENPRAALTLANHSVYLMWASSCDVDPYHGWVMAYDLQTLAQKAVLNVNPDGSEAGIWLSDTGPAVDSDGNLYVPTGNGTFDATSGGRDFGDSVLKLDGSSLAVRDYFTPFDQADILAGDSDVGSAGPTLLPDQPGAHRHLLLQPTKHSILYVIDRDEMGKFHPDRDAVPQKIRMAGEGLGAMAYWNSHVYFAANHDLMRDLFSGERTTPTAQFLFEHIRAGRDSVHLRERRERRHSLGHLHQGLGRPRYETSNSLRLRCVEARTANLHVRTEQPTRSRGDGRAFRHPGRRERARLFRYEKRSRGLRVAQIADCRRSRKDRKTRGHTAIRWPPGP